MPAPTRPYIAFVLVLVALAGVLAYWGTRERPVDPGAELAALVPGHRPLEARPTFPLPHAPFSPGAGLVDREAIFARLVRAKTKGVPGGPAAVAAFYAVQKEPGDVERALRASVAPVDRAAILLALDRPAEALEALAAALAEHPDDPAARFDRAVILERLLLDGQAALAWEAFLAVEPEGPWAEEARERLHRLSSPPPPAPTLEARKRDATLALYEPRPHDPEAWRPLARELAELGDSLLLRELDYLASLDASGWRRREAEARRLAAARGEVFAGRDRSPELQVLAGAADPLVGVKALHFAAYSAILRGDYDAAREGLSRLEERCLRVGCLEELALARSDLGSILLDLGDANGALAAFAEARQLLPAAFVDRRAELLRKEAHVLQIVDAPEAASRLLADGLRGLRNSGFGERVDNLLLVYARAWEDRELRSAAEATYREAIRLARIDGDAKCELESSIDLSRLLAREDRGEEGLVLLEAAARRLAETDLEVQLARLEQEIAERLLETGDLAGARGSAERAVDRIPPGNSWASAPLEILARTARRQGDLSAAREAASRAVALEEARAVSSPGKLSRLRVREATATSRLLLGLVLAESGAVEDAFRAVAGPSLAPDPGECRIAFGHVEGILFSLAQGVGGTWFSRWPVAEEELRAAIRAGGEELDRVVGSVFAPVRCPPDSRRIVLVQHHGSLPARLATRIHHLHPEVLVAVAPRVDRPWPGALTVRRSLSVHDPKYQSDRILPYLPAAAEEARILAARFPEAEDLSGASATPARVRELAPGADLLHFGVHGISRIRSGAASYLQLAGSPGRLGVAEILDFDLRERRPLVLLPACNTAGVVESLEHDGAGLPWAFLEAGASAVIAAEGALDDPVALTFTRGLASALSGGHTIPEAFREGMAAVERKHSRDAAVAFVLYF